MLGVVIIHNYNACMRADCPQGLPQEAAVMGVVRGVLLARPGAEGAHGGTLQELVRRLPGDLFRTCLARVTRGTGSVGEGLWLSTKRLLLLVIFTGVWL